MYIVRYVSNNEIIAIVSREEDAKAYDNPIDEEAVWVEDTKADDSD